MDAPPPQTGLSLEPMEGEKATTEEQVQSAPGESCPKCGSERIEEGSCLECGIIIQKFRAREQNRTNEEDSEKTVVLQPSNTPPEPPPTAGSNNPYATPQAEVAFTQEVDDEEITGPNGRPFGHGWQWISQGFWHFRQNPLAWILAIVAWIILSVIASLIPFVGALASMLFTPVIIAGFMVGAHEQQQGGDFEFAHLFAGFSRGTAQLVIVGGLYLVGMIVVLVIAMFMGGGMMAMLGMAGMAGGEADMSAAMFSGSIVLTLLVMMLVMIPMMMAYWFAPALIALEDMTAISAMKLSFMGCIKNILPFLLYGIVATILMFIAAIPVGLGLLVAAPMMTASMYTAYRDIYYS